MGPSVKLVYPKVVLFLKEKNGDKKVIKSVEAPIGSKTIVNRKAVRETL